jgi:acyl-coenzyme A thioesterase 9
VRIPHVARHFSCPRGSVILLHPPLVNATAASYKDRAQGRTSGGRASLREILPAFAGVAARKKAAVATEKEPHLPCRRIIPKPERAWQRRLLPATSAQLYIPLQLDSNQLHQAMHRAASRLAASARASLPTARPPLIPRLAHRSLAGTATQQEATPASLLTTEHAVAETEGEAVTRIDSLLKLTDRLSRQSKNAALPLNLRAQGLYEKDAPAQPVAVDEGEELVPLPQTRRMGDSFVQLDLPFSKDASLREQYVGGISKVRMGRLMEDFDSLAGAAAYRYVLPDGVDIATAQKYGFYLVTAAVDRMDLLRPLQNADGSIPDLRLSGHVSYTTSSSLEVFLRMATIPSSPSEESSTILIGRFAMACRSAKGGKHRVPELLVDGPEEQAMWSMGRDMREGKKKRSSASLNKTPPTEEEAAMLHDLFLQKPELYGRS